MYADVDLLRFQLRVIHPEDLGRFGFLSTLNETHRRANYAIHLSYELTSAFDCDFGVTETVRKWSRRDRATVSPNFKNRSQLFETSHLTGLRLVTTEGVPRSFNRDGPKWVEIVEIILYYADRKNRLRHMFYRYTSTGLLTRMERIA